LKKISHGLHGFAQSGWHPQPIIPAGIRTHRKKNPGIKTRFQKKVIQMALNSLQKAKLIKNSTYNFKKFPNSGTLSK